MTETLTPKQHRKHYNNPTQAKYTEGVSYDDESMVCLNDGLRYLDMFYGKVSGILGGRSYHLRKAAVALKMAADRMDHAKELKGETLEPFIEEDDKP